MKITRKLRHEHMKIDQKAARAVNAPRKASERGRRDARMIAKVRAGKLPYPPAVMSWLSRRLDKPATKISQADVQKLIG